MKEIPKKIEKLLAGPLESDMELGLYLLLDYFSSAKEYRKWLANLYMKNKISYSTIAGNFSWVDYFNKNKIYEST